MEALQKHSFGICLQAINYILFNSSIEQIRESLKSLAIPKHIVESSLNQITSNFETLRRVFPHDEN